jgi:RND family efflux transporter MFP subunit
LFHTIGQNKANAMHRTTLTILLALASAPAWAQDTTVAANGAAAGQPIQAVDLVEVLEGPWTAVWEAYGVLQANEMAQARTEGAGGTVQAVLVEEGDVVVEGEPLVQLDGTDADFALREAQNALEIARTDLREQESLLARAQALGDNTAQATLDTLVFATDKARVAVERAGLVVLEAEEDTRRTVVRSPVAGRVVSIEAVLGAQATGATVVAHVAQQDKWVWEGGLPTRAAAALAVGMPVDVQAGQQRWQGSVARVAPRVDANGLAVVAVDLHATPATLPLEGATAQATFRVEQGSGVALPIEAITYRNGLPWVATVGADGTVAFTPITVREVGGGNFLVDGLEAGVRIVARGAGFLSEGQRVVEAAGSDALGTNPVAAQDGGTQPDNISTGGSGDGAVAP